MKKTTSDNANFTKIADLLELPYKLRGQKVALRLVKKIVEDRAAAAAAADPRKLAA
jgi:hypothetical protein